MFKYIIRLRDRVRGYTDVELQSCIEKIERNPEIGDVIELNGPGEANAAERAARIVAAQRN